jgi:peptidylprolyl isomerase
MRLLLLCLVQAFVLSTVAQKRQPYPEGLYAEVTTSKGLIVLQLEFEKTPTTVANFVGLAEGTIDNELVPAGKPYYDGGRWYRVAPGHVIQCGSPANTESKGPGFTFPNEIVLPDLNHGRAGMVTMANGGPHTNSSHWCITLSDRSYLDGDYTVFGHVIKGLEIPPTITQEDIIKTIRIVRVGSAANAFHPTTTSFNAMVEALKDRVAVEEVKKKVQEEAFIQNKWPEAKAFMSYVITKEGEGPRPKTGGRMRMSYKGQFPGGESFVSTADAGKPWYGALPETFEFVVGSSSINAGFDAGAMQMRKGEKRVMIIPSEQAYGPQGYYPPQRPGEKRFHVSPYKTIVYEVECFEVINP